VIFIGQPNCGKSTIFNAIAGFKAETSNFPGTTVAHTHSKVNVEGKLLNIIDLPGTYSLNPADEGEKVALTHLFSEKPDLIINVVDASILGRGLELTLQLIEMEYPMVLALNMMDQAEKKGISIDIPKLEKLLGIPVVPLTASHGKGIRELLDECFDVLDHNKTPPPIYCSKDVEDNIDILQRKIPDDFPILATRRFTAIKMIESGRLFFEDVLKEIFPDLKKDLDNVRKALESQHSAPAYEVIAAERHHLAMKFFEQSSRVQRGKQVDWKDRVDDVIMHPFLGYVFLSLVFFSFFFVIFRVGNPLEEFILGPAVAMRQALSLHLGSGLFYYVADGLLQGVIGGVAIVLPYFVPLLIMMSLLEDVGYLARAGFLMDTFMHRIGLHGKSISPLILGFGCNVPAIAATRILESRRDRIITALLVPFIPCSARTTIILALVASFLGPVWAFGFYVANIFLIALLSRIISLFFKTPSPGLILEIPTLKRPSIQSILKKTYFQLKSFIRFAWPILIAGSAVLGLLQFFHLDRTINVILAPLVEKALGLPKDLGVTLIFGFLRKELSLIMMLQSLDVGYQELMTVITKGQLIIFTVFISFFIPCVSTVAMLWKELGRRIAMISVALNVGIAILLSLLTRLLLGI